MGCLLVIVSVMMPRIMLIVIALVTNWISQSYETVIWPFFGWLFMPYTTLAYMAAMLNNDHHVSGGWLILVIIAVLFDLGGQGQTVSEHN